MKISFSYAIWKNFLGQTPNWYKLILIFFLILNPIIFSINSFICGWLLVAEFIFTLAMALECYPLLSGGLLAIEAIFIGMTNITHVHEEIKNNLEVLLLLIFMIAGIHFIKKLLLFIFTNLLLNIHSKKLLSMTFCITAALLSSFLDALTVIAVLISVAVGLYETYNQVFYSCKNIGSYIKYNNLISNRKIDYHKILKQFRSFLRSLMMHASVGTALGGVMTIVGEPQNLIIAKAVGWNFSDFFLHMAPISIPVFFSGLLTCYLVEKFHFFGYGAEIPPIVQGLLREYNNKNKNQRTPQDILELIVQGIISIWLIIALALQLAEIGLVGLSIIILATSFTGITDEHKIGQSFTESLPFAALLIVFFTIVTIIVDQHLFKPIIEFALRVSPNAQLTLFYLLNGLLSSISDNVFVATVYINEAKAAFGRNTISAQQLEYLAVGINTGTNLPSIATPNGQAGFLFLLTSAIAPLIHLSYKRMVWMALPYTLVLTLVGLLCIRTILIPYTQWLIQIGMIATH